MRQFSPFVLASLTAMLGACSAPPVVTQVPLGSDLALTGGTYTHGLSGGLTVASELREINGRAAVCGVWTETPDLHPWVRGSAAMQLLPSGAVYLGGTRLLQNLTFLTKVDPQANYTGQQANCALSDQPWTGAYARAVPDVRIPNQDVYREIDDSGAGFVVRFRQTGPGA